MFLAQSISTHQKKQGARPKTAMLKNVTDMEKNELD